ncbi:alpha/beta hydrolase [Patescibacteria group bacterium]|nr:alpha/beta hydrolase [Patescibacteria group bacterium]
MNKARNILLIHGWGARGGKLLKLSLELKKIGWKVLILKLPGFDLPPPKEAWSLDDYADFVLNKANSYFKSGDFFLFGHSFGGRIAVKLALGEPKRLKGMILCAAAGFSRASLAKRIVFSVLSKIGRIFLLYPPLAKLFRKIIYGVAREHDYEKTTGVMREVFKKVVSENLKKIVPRIKVPSLILWGREDRMTPVSAAYFLQKALPKSKLVVFDNEGHRLPYERPVELATEIEKWFLTLV